MLILRHVSNGSPPDRTSAREVNRWCDEAGEVFARLLTDAVTRWIDWPGLGVFAFAPHARDVQVWPAADARPEVIADTFARVVQPAILQALGWQAFHASAVVGPRGVLGFCGMAHSGKSTLAYVLPHVHPELRQFGDDALVVSLDRQHGVVAHALPFTPRLRASSRQHFEWFEHAADRLRTAAMSSPVAVAALFVLKQDEMLEGAPRMLRISGVRAFSELLTHAHCFDLEDAGEARRIAEDYLEIARRVPVFTITYRPDLEHLLDLVELVLNASDVTAADAMALVR